MERKRWGDKPYHSLDYEMRQRFGEKVYRLPLNAGMTCPNRDGTIDTRGCIFCSGAGAGEFAAEPQLSVSEQIRIQKELVCSKRPIRLFIAYFQAFTNTYAPAPVLRKIYEEAVCDPQIAVLDIATRPDCLPPDVMDLLGQLNERVPVWVELGLQTIREDTAAYIRRGYALPCFENAVRELRHRGIEVIVHTILGLPGEGREDTIRTMRYLNGCDIQGIKMHLLHVLKDTDLAEDYLAGKVPVLSQDEYLDQVIGALEVLKPGIVIHRLTGDGPADQTLAPLWSLNKRAVLNALHSRLRQLGTWQGRLN